MAWLSTSVPSQSKMTKFNDLCPFLPLLCHAFYGIVRRPEKASHWVSRFTLGNRNRTPLWLARHAAQFIAPRLLALAWALH
jgi:hypothetical protein